ncbi:dopachrome-conversion enzyme [Culex quinquefasciatus]|uniref:Dopachrome-conversion enzyme n=1 Tax=Culex quinquefasciatus TaxID=7176 RepID=B0W603_CULQU|nr:dopachrome-conversion enzyme [Culex quinquefasciatus]|eukprot:XP_001844137.1 dopachrome-conversion enzyme [Culex quinquefasciatus]
MGFMKIILNVLLLVRCWCIAEELELVYQWDQLSSAVSSEHNDILFDAQQSTTQYNESFNAYGNLPMGVSHHKGRLFVTVPRRRPGIPATLNVINMGKVTEVNNPTLLGYPDYLTNTLHQDYSADPKRIISVYRTKVDKCDRLWFVDTGYLEYPGNRRQVQRPALWVINLNTNRRVRRFEIPKEIVEFGYGMPNLEIDVEPGKCDEAYAYIADYQWQGLYVYGLAEDRMWRFKHNFFSFEPRYGRFNIAGQQFVWNDGLFSLAVGARNKDTGDRSVYLHAMAAISEIVVPNSVLKNETLSRSGEDHYAERFKHMGSRGPNTQSSSHAFDEKTGVLFYAEVNRNAIGCWNSAQEFHAENHGIVHLDNENMIYPADLTIDNDSVLWVISNRLPIWIYSKLNTTDFNYRIWRQSTEKSIDGTICA